MSLREEYEVIEALPTTSATVRLDLARPAGSSGPATVVLKSPVRIVGVDDPEDVTRRHRAFCRSCDVWRSVSESRHWVTVRDFTATPTEALLVTDRFDRNLTGLRRTGLLDSDALRRIALGVLDGIRDLQDACHRGHGRISTANILVRRKGRRAIGEIGLTDSAPVAPPPTGDLRDLGLVIWSV
ncbi:MAG: hypothetical protein KDA28_11850, partial [Phycisphaerales bacterium]|nr:hypothetical protein [Phycisphaerales bacterium]